MDDKERLLIVENLLAQMLKPVRGIPFNVIIKSLSEKEVIKFDTNNENDVALLAKLTMAIEVTTANLRKSPIRRPRPNEVGNDIEHFGDYALDNP